MMHCIQAGARYEHVVSCIATPSPSPFHAPARAVRAARAGAFFIASTRLSGSPPRKHQKHQKHRDALDANDASRWVHHKHQTLYTEQHLAKVNLVM